SEATKFGRSGVELLGVVGAARIECGEPAAESGELIRRQLGTNFGDFFYFHGAHYSTGWPCSATDQTVPGCDRTVALEHDLAAALERATEIPHMPNIPISRTR